MGRMRSYFFIDVGEILCRQIGRGDLGLMRRTGVSAPNAGAGRRVLWPAVRPRAGRGSPQQPRAPGARLRCLS